MVRKSPMFEEGGVSNNFIFTKFNEVLRDNLGNKYLVIYDVIF